MKRSWQKARVCNFAVLAGDRAINVRTANERNRRGRSGRHRGDKTVVETVMARRHGAFNEVSGFAVVAQHLFVKHASGVRPMGRTTHSGATRHTSFRAAGQQSQWRGEQSDDDENGLSAAHVEPQS